jgi:hypothetical protein
VVLSLARSKAYQCEVLPECLISLGANVNHPCTRICGNVSTPFFEILSRIIWNDGKVSVTRCVGTRSTKSGAFALLGSARHSLP